MLKRISIRGCATAVPKKTAGVSKEDLQGTEIIEMEDGKKREETKFLTSRKLVFTNKQTAARVEVYPLFLMNVSQWYIKRTLSELTNNKNYSTVFIGVPFIGVKHDTGLQATRSWSPKSSLEVTSTVDFPRVIHIPNPKLCPAFAYIHSREEYVSMLLGKPSGMDRFTKALKNGAHTEDTVAVLTQPKGMQILLENLTQEHGWEVEGTRVSVVPWLNRTYGLFLHGLAVFVKSAFVVAVLCYLPRLPSDLDYIQRKFTEDNKERHVALEDVRYYSASYKPEQDKAVQLLRDRLLAAPPGSGDDTRVHETFWSKPFRWEKVALPKPPTAYRMKEDGVVEVKVKEE
eukprot:TRINITY_DN1307_c1_g3_i1.p1 TRINITY_DN1307_c1_g3~~TRINITY_DN1307_c1_g3_i1.p1  ORF type:complete len:359 (+),score=73.48 TRINITY_DN1307_c1_g3_i1:47-1078(+)